MTDPLTVLIILGFIVAILPPGLLRIFTALCEATVGILMLLVA